MSEGRGGDEYGRSRGELDDEFDIPEYQVATLGGVEVAECRDATPAEGAIQDVAVLERPDMRSEVESCCGENGLREVGFKVREGSVHSVEGRLIVSVNARGPKTKGRYVDSLF